MSLHNGRTFVGPSYNLQHISAMDVTGWRVLQVRRKQGPLPCALAHLPMQAPRSGLNQARALGAITPMRRTPSLCNPLP